jgi:ATP-dependent Zn protease
MANRPQQPSNPNRLRTFFVWAAIALLLIIGFFIVRSFMDGEPEISYSEFHSRIGTSETTPIKSVEIRDHKITGTFKTAQKVEVIRGGEPGGIEEASRFKVTIPFDDPGLVDTLRKSNILVIA